MTEGTRVPATGWISVTLAMFVCCLLGQVRPWAHTTVPPDPFIGETLSDLSIRTDCYYRYQRLHRTVGSSFGARLESLDCAAEAGLGDASLVEDRSLGRSCDFRSPALPGDAPECGARRARYWACLERQDRYVGNCKTGLE